MFRVYDLTIKGQLSRIKGLGFGVRIRIQGRLGSRIQDLAGIRDYGLGFKVWG